jgi:Flp pilus assembly protein TadG
MSYSNKRRNQRGNALLEFALGWFLLWLLFSGAYEFGYGFYVYNRLITAVADAAELGSKISYDTGNPSAFTTTLQNMVLYGTETAGTSPIVSGLTASNVSVAVTLDGNSIPRDVTVSITGYSINAFFTTTILTGKPRATVKYFGLIACSTC